MRLATIDRQDTRAEQSGRKWEHSSDAARSATLVRAEGVLRPVGESEGHACIEEISVIWICNTTCALVMHPVRRKSISRSFRATLRITFPRWLTYAIVKKAFGERLKILAEIDNSMIRRTGFFSPYFRALFS
jgi:hypothetical protein